MSAQHGNAPGFRAIRWNMDWVLRPLFGIGLALVAIFALRAGPLFFAGVIALALIPAAHEWHRMVARGAPYRMEAVITACAAALATLAVAYTQSAAVALVIVALGAIAAAILAWSQGSRPGWQALGALYLGVPGVALSALRTFPSDGVLIILGLFVIVWATDTGALICGNLIGGPRLAPVLSPSKTWAGTLGGSLIAGAAFAGFIHYLHGAALPAFLFGVLLSFTAHAGDLYESSVKRRFGVKDSGAIIPGHGGALDRMDSILAAGSVLALLVFVFHLNPLFGGQA